MGQWTVKKNREIRYSVSGIDVCGTVVACYSPKEFEIFVCNLSHSGIGFYINHPLTLGAFHVVSIDSPHKAVIPCRVVWCRIDGRLGLFKVGLKAIDPYEDSLRAILNSL